MIRAAYIFAILLAPLGLLAFVVALPAFFEVLAIAIDPSVAAVDPTISQRWLFALEGFLPALAFWGAAILLWLLAGIAKDVRSNKRLQLTGDSREG